MQENLKSILKNTINQIYQIEVDPLVEIPNNKEHGDFSSNIAMKLARDLKQSPLDISNEIKLEIENQKIEMIKEIDVVNPGFINFKIDANFYKNIVLEILEKKDLFGRNIVGENKKVMIEFGQPNTHKAFHVGHLKSAISGFSLVKLYENLGYEVIKTNFFGDIGMHVAKSTWGFLNKEKPQNFEKLGVHEQMKYIDSCYVFGAKAFKEDESLQKEIKQINKDIYAGENNESYKTYKFLREVSIKHQTEIWKSLGIRFDREYPESEIYKDAIKIVENYKKDIFEESNGAIIYNGEKEGLTTWVFLTSEGHPTYSSKDLALAYKKFEEYPDLEKAFVTTSVEQKEYFRVVIHVLEKIKPEVKGRYFHVPFGWMLRQDGKKFSSRMGETVKGVDILEEVLNVARSKVSILKDYSKTETEEIASKVAIAGLKFLILSHEFHKDFSYDPDKFLSFEGFSGPYILYSYARAKSILRKSEIDSHHAEGMQGRLEVNSNTLNTDYEIDLLKHLSQYPNTAINSANLNAPHLVALYLYELAQKFNKFYTECPVLNADKEEDKLARLALSNAVSQVIKNGLNLLGIETVEKM